VLIVVDRRDLKTQLSDDFDACDYPNVEKALGVEHLKARLRNERYCMNGAALKFEPAA
jgi:type I restriction enzyme R subunit